MSKERLKAERITSLVDWTRDFTSYDDDKNVVAKYDDVIYKKLKIQKIFDEDPDLKDMLGMPEVIPIIDGMTEEQKIEIQDRNDRISRPEIIPWIKLNGVVKTVSNKILFDIQTERGNYDYPIFSRQLLHVVCLVDETSMETDFQIPRVDLVAYIVKDLLNRSDWTGMTWLLWSDEPKIIDNSFYARELIFALNQPNISTSHLGNGNRYDNVRHV